MDQVAEEVRIGRGVLVGHSIGDGGLIFFDLVVLMRWLLIGLLISVVALLVVAGAAVRHIRRQRTVPVEKSLEAERDLELNLPEAPDSKGSGD